MLRNRLFAVAAVAAFALVGEGVEVSTVGDLTAALSGAESEIVIAEGTYEISSVLSVKRAVTVRAADGASVTIDANSKCACLSINHADAVVEGLRLYRGKLGGPGAGVSIGTNGGTLRNCIVESCKCSSVSKGPGIYMNSANALVTGCQVLRCGTDGFNGDYECHGVYIDNGVLDHTLVVGCQNTSTYRDGKKGTAAVYLLKGTVKNCTIVGNEVSHYALYCADAADCHVIDTISWGNVSLRGVDANCPNANDYGSKADVVNLCIDNPMFANTSDYSLAPDSPCIGAGADGGDLGWKAYDASVPAIGVRVSASKGTTPMEVAVGLTANVPVTSVVWEGVEATGTDFTTTLDGGFCRIRATATLADGGTLTAENVVEVTYPAGEYEVTDVGTLEALLSSPLADGVVIKLADGDYPMSANCHVLKSGVKIVGTSRQNTVLSKATNAKGRFFYMNHEDAELDNLTMTGGNAGCNAGGVWIDGRGGTVSNCTVRGCKTGASQPGGGVWMNSPNALVTHSVISGNIVGQNTYCGGVLLSQGTLADSLIVSNTAQYATRAEVKGVGVYMDKATPNAKVVNCTIARNNGCQSVGLYRVSNGGYVYNTIVFDNTASDHNEDDNFYSGGGSIRPNATAILNCASTVALGTNPQTLSALPYNPSTYELDASTGGACIDKGANDGVVSAKDFYGNDRIFQGKTVDIGAHEYSSVEIKIGFTVSTTKGVDSAEVTLEASVLGATVGDDAISWYFDGADEPSGTGKVLIRTFGIGRHSIRMAVDIGGTVYEAHSDDTTGIVISPSHVYVDANSTAEPAWPYGKDAPATDFNAAAAEMLQAGVTIHVAEGLYPMTNRVHLGPDEHIVGAGMDRTVLYHPTGETAGFWLKSPSSTVDGLCVSNSSAGYGGGFRIEAGTVTRCKVSHCEAGINENGGGVYIAGPNSVFDRGVVSCCSRLQWNGMLLAYGGGVALKNGGTLRNSLVERCTSNNAGGVFAESSSVVCNCTVVSNTCSLSGKGVGGILASADSRVENCIAWGNVDKDLSDPTLAKHNIDGGSVTSCCFPVSVGADCVTADPQFRDAANGDYRIGASSPCAYAGRYDASWMPGATDISGRPRTTPGKRVSIGCCQAPDPGMTLFVR